MAQDLTTEQQTLAMVEAAPLEIRDDVASKARVAAEDDQRLSLDMLGRTARLAVAAWALAVNGDHSTLTNIGPADVLYWLLHPVRKPWQVGPGPVVTRIDVWGLEPDARPPELQLSFRFSGRRRYDDGQKASGDSGGQTMFQGIFTMALAGRGSAVLCTFLRVDDPDDRGTPQAYRDHRVQDATAVVARIRDGGGRAAAVEADLSDPAAPVMLFDTAEEQFGPVDILINNATGWLADTFAAAPADRLGRSLQPVTAATSLVWHEERLRGTTSRDFEEQITRLQPFLSENWTARVSPASGNPVYEKPVVLVLYRDDYRFLLDHVRPRRGVSMADYDLVLASQPYRARASVEFKALKVLAPLARALAPGDACPLGDHERRGPAERCAAERGDLVLFTRSRLRPHHESVAHRR